MKCWLYNFDFDLILMLLVMVGGIIGVYMYKIMKIDIGVCLVLVNFVLMCCVKLVLFDLNNNMLDDCLIVLGFELE